MLMNNVVFGKNMEKTRVNIEILNLSQKKEEETTWWHNQIIILQSYQNIF